MGEIQIFELGPGQAGRIDHAAIAHDADPGGDILGAEDIVGGHQQRCAAGGGFLQNGDKIIGSSGIKPR